MRLGDVEAKFKSFGWDAVTINGHDIQAIYDALTARRNPDKPFAIIADTVKGKGVSFMEDQAGWHGVAPCEKQCQAACDELEPQLDEAYILDADAQTAFSNYVAADEVVRGDGSYNA
jgi:transketolase